MKQGLDANGKVAIVTGGSSGIGFGIAKALAEFSATVVVVDIQDKAKLEHQFMDVPGPTAYYEADVAQPSEIQAVVAEVVKRFGKVDILVNNAGIAHVDPIGEINFDRWSRLIEINLKGAAVCANSVAPFMTQSGWGRIINISSAWAIVGVQTYSAYGASKAGIKQLSRIWAAELAPYGITVNSICPGWVKTPMLPNFISRLAALHQLPVEKVLEEVLHYVPQKRFLEVEEIAFSAVFLCSELAGGITGTELVVDAGLTSTLPDGLFTKKGKTSADYGRIKDEIFMQM